MVSMAAQPNVCLIGDNIGGGSAADSTFILAEAISQGTSSSQYISMPQMHT